MLCTLGSKFKMLIPALALLVPMSAWALDWAGLKEILASRTFLSIEEIVEALPEEFRKNYVLQMASESPQYATPTEPRVILYSNDGKLLLAISGGPEGMSTSPIIEAVEYDELTHTSRPHLVQLQSSSALGSTPKVRILENPSDLYPVGHPRNCATCHGSPFRLIWDSYSHWPQTYGSGFRDPLLTPIEQAKWERFQKVNSKKGIYRHLPEVGRVSFSEMTDKNTELTHLLNAQNEEKIFERVRHNPVLQRYRREVLAALVLDDSEEFAAHLNPELRTDFLAGQTQRREAILAATADNTQRKKELYRRALGGVTEVDSRFVSDFDFKHAEKLARIQYFMDRAGVSMADWSMTRGLGTYSFSDPLQIFHSLSVRFYREVVLPREPEWVHLVQVHSSVYNAHHGYSSKPLRTFLDAPTERLTSLNLGEDFLNLRRDVFQAMASGRSPSDLLRSDFPFLRPPAPPPVEVCPKKFGSLWRIWLGGR